MKLILASASPRRRDLLEQAGYRFDVIPAAVDEIHDPGMPLPDLAMENARLKAEAVAASHPGAIIIGADTLVCLEDHLLGKPADLDEAACMLTTLAGQTHQVCTGVCLHRAGGDEATACFHELTDVTFRNLNGPEIATYLRQINPLDKAGAYAAQEHGSMIIEKTEGSWTNVVGLPMERLRAEFERFLQEPAPR